MGFLVVFKVLLAACFIGVIIILCLTRRSR